MKRQCVPVFFAILVALASVSLRKALANAPETTSPWQSSVVTTSHSTFTQSAILLGASPAPAAPHQQSLAIGGSPMPPTPLTGSQVAIGGSPMPPTPLI